MIPSLHHKQVVEWVAWALGKDAKGEKIDQKKGDELEGDSALVASAILEWCREKPENKRTFWTEMYCKLLPSAQMLKQASTMAEADTNIVNAIKVVKDAILQASGTTSEG